MAPKRFQAPIFREQPIEEKLSKACEDLLPNSIWDEDKNWWIREYLEEKLKLVNS
jgi:hypothetical protein